MRKSSTLILVTPMLAALTGAAGAHAWLLSAIPPVDSTVTDAPGEITITFTGAIEPRFSTIEVTSPDAKRVDDAQPRLAAPDGTRLAVGVKGITPGTYTVAWHATSVDTHQTDGSYRFTVAAMDQSGIGLEHVWARATPGGATTGAVYFTVTSKGSPDRLVGASTPAAATAEMHETTNDNGVMKMRPVRAVELDPGKPVTFKPGGYHVMLMGLKSPLKAGDSFPLTLTFEHAPPVTVTATVEAMGTGGAGAMPGMSGH
jgi:periplasmic copper chaperone A